MAEKNTLTKINSILKILDEESRLVLLRELQFMKGYLLAESIDNRKGSNQKMSMKEIVDEVKKVRRKRNSGRKHAA